MSKKKGAGENIRVVIRSRNLLENELQRGDKQAVRMDLATQQVIVNRQAGDPDTFAFDAVYNNNFTQRDIFVQEVQPLLESVLQGYNATVFAYGQSGSGKTHTMTGNLAERSTWGMMPQAVDHLFSEIKKLTSPSKTFKVKVSYVELYNSKSRDLLAAKQVNLEIKENMAKNFYVKGAETPEVTGFDECIRYFQSGTDRRQTASTDLNDHSSRSHSLFSMIIDQMDFEQDPSSPVVMTSKINIVDLAGSEKLSKTNATGDTAVEGNNINLSLSALATVIDTIVKGAKHIPYRGNPLTMLLKDSLGGNAKTVMFANCGPSEKNVAETISTLRFAMRAKQIENKPIKNLDPKDAKIQELLDKIEQLQKKLGGNFNPEEEENLQRRVDELEMENAELRGSQDKDNLELEEKSRLLQAEVEQLNGTLKQKEHDLAAALRDNEIAEANIRQEAEYSGEIKSVASNFIKRVMNPQEISNLRSQMPKDGDYNLTDDGWELREIQFYLEGFVGLYEAWRASVHTDDDLKKMIGKATADVEASLQRQLNEANRMCEELGRQQAESAAQRTSDGELQSQLKVDFAAVKEENAKLREKVERDQEKMKKKIDKMKEDNRGVVEELENTKSALATAQTDLEKMKKLLEESGARIAVGGSSMASSASGSGPTGQWASERQKLLDEIEEVTNSRNSLESKLKQTTVQLRRKGFCLKDNTSLLGSDAPPPPPGSEHNDGFIIDAVDGELDVDGDLLGSLQQQIRIQHRLHELRHQHQKKLDDMVRKFELIKTGKVTSNSVEGSISDEVLQSKIAEAIASKTAELDALKAEHEKVVEKLIKKLNKLQSESTDLKSTMADDRATLDEERKELAEQNDELQKFNQHLAVEVESLRAQLNAAQSDSDRALRAKDNEITHHKQDVAQLLADMEDTKTKIALYERLQEDYSKLQGQNQRNEASLREKQAQLDNNRQTAKWSSSMLDAEKKRVVELEDQIKEQETQYHAMEDSWRAQLSENVNKLVAINNRRLEEQAAEYQALIMDEKQKQDLVRDKLRKAKAATSKAAQRYDEMVLENEALQAQFEELKVSAMKIFREKQEAQRDLDAFSKPRQRGF